MLYTEQLETHDDGNSMIGLNQPLIEAEVEYTPDYDSDK